MPDAPQRLSVLIVDDNQQVAWALGAVLEKAGYRAAVFHCAADAIAHVRHSPPAAAVIDIHLPDMSGLTLSQQIRQQMPPQAPIIILSGDASMENLKALPDAGATCFFSKPVKASQLLERLSDLLA